MLAATEVVSEEDEFKSNGKLIAKSEETRLAKSRKLRCCIRHSSGGRPALLSVEVVFLQSNQ